MNAADLIRRVPDFTVNDHVATQHYKQPADHDHYQAALLQTGLPAGLPPSA